MTTATILKNLETVFAELDAKFVENQQEWAKGRVAAISAIKKTEGFKFDSEGYTKLFNAAGGKTWYNIFDGRNAAMIEEIVTKNCATIIAKRNHKIAAKLDEAKIFEVIGCEFSHTDDGFNGVFRVSTENGFKTVIIETIFAGGYNIQCFHTRTLVKIK